MVLLFQMLGFHLKLEQVVTLLWVLLDQGTATWYEAQNLISDPSNHSADGGKFSDWRMPTKYELNEMYVQRAAIGGFGASNYWSSTKITFDGAWIRGFGAGDQFGDSNVDSNFVRAIRAFNIDAHFILSAPCTDDECQHSRFN